jgi:hypothetical protein
VVALILKFLRVQWDLTSLAKRAAFSRKKASSFPCPQKAGTGFVTLDKIEGTLDYPPEGSPEAGQEHLKPAAGAERLSSGPLVSEDLEETANENLNSSKRF